MAATTPGVRPVSDAVPEDAAAAFRERYQRGPDQFANWVHDKLPVRLSAAQQRILRGVAEHKRVVVIGANGPGKSYAAACLAEAFLHSRRPSTVLATSGTYGKLKRTLCRPIQSLQHHDDLEHPLPGRYKHNPPRIDTGDPEWFFEASRPKDAGELEGTHSRHLLAITEEADKDAVDAEVIESVDSCRTDANDRHLVIANPPRDEGNVVYDLMESDSWATVRVPTWESRNVLVDAGEHDGPKIPGLLDLSEVITSWETWNGEPWPGLEAAKTAHERRDDLDERWYRRRAGVMPPETASVARPFHASDAKAAHIDRAATNYFGAATRSTRPLGTGLDVAGPGSDRTVAVTYYRNGDLDVRYTERSAAYPEQEQALMADDRLGGDRTHPVAVDAAGEGSGLADYLDDRLSDVYRFSSSKTPLTDGTDSDNPYGATNYESQRGEALAALGDVLASGEVRYVDTDLREELVIGGRTIEYGTRTLASRGENGAEVVTVNSKDAVAERLGHSPDYLDAAAQAVWARACTPDELDASDVVVL